MGTAKDRDQVRAFIAIELPATVRQFLGREIQRLRAALPTSMRWVRPDSVHLTLKFLGNVPQEQVPAIVDALRTACRYAQPIELSTGPIGCFPNPRRARVLWIGIEGELDALRALQEKVDDAMQALGFAREERSFVAHLTLARAKSGGAEVEMLEELIAEGPRQGETFTAAGLNLMRSILTPQGAVYTRLALLHLGERDDESADEVLTGQ